MAPRTRRLLRRYMQVTPVVFSPFEAQLFGRYYILLVIYPVEGAEQCDESYCIHTPLSALFTTGAAFLMSRGEIRPGSPARRDLGGSFAVPPNAAYAVMALTC